jgi:aspartate racemase
LKTIGLIGGMSWESTALYYKLINEGVRDALGPLRSASLLVYSYDFERIKTLQYAGRWEEAGDDMANVAHRLETAGAKAMLICTNTMHKVAPMVEARITVPLLHLADCTAKEVVKNGIERVALLGTRFTMEEDFYSSRLEARGLEVLVPCADDIAEVNRVIYDELCQGVVLDRSRERYKTMIGALEARGAQGVILGCTEIGLLIGPQDASVPTFDTTAIHAAAAVEFAIG